MHIFFMSRQFIFHGANRRAIGIHGWTKWIWLLYICTKPAFRMLQWGYPQFLTSLAEWDLLHPNPLHLWNLLDLLWDSRNLRSPIEYAEGWQICGRRDVSFEKWIFHCRNLLDKCHQKVWWGGNSLDWSRQSQQDAAREQAKTSFKKTWGYWLKFTNSRRFAFWKFEFATQIWVYKLQVTICEVGLKHNTWKELFIG